jgi:hypothetical protein
VYKKDIFHKIRILSSFPGIEDNGCDNSRYPAAEREYEDKQNGATTPVNDGKRREDYANYGS